MARQIKQIFVYTKVTCVCLLLAAIVVLIVKNWGFQTRFWPGAAHQDVPTLWLMLVTSLVSIVAYWILSKLRHVFADLAELRADRAQRKAIAEQEHRSKALQEQERRIDKKIQKALEEDNP